MTRRQRQIHARVWPLLAIVVAIGFAMALVLRPSPEVSTPTASQETRP